MKFFWPLILFSVSASSTELCKEYFGTCDYYLCLNSHFECEANNYLEDFGDRYCRKFDRSAPEWSSALQSWLPEVKACLQERMIEVDIDWTTPDKRNCKALQKHAIDVHSDCYFDTGFCSLERSDRRRVERKLYRALWRKRLFREGLQIRRGCRRL